MSVCPPSSYDLSCEEAWQFKGGSKGQALLGGPLVAWVVLCFKLLQRKKRILCRDEKRMNRAPLINQRWIVLDVLHPLKAACRLAEDEEICLSFCFTPRPPIGWLVAC